MAPIPNEISPEEDVVLLQPKQNALECVEPEVMETEKKREVAEVQNPNGKSEIDGYDCSTGLMLCCNFLQECWLALCACGSICDSGCCTECINGTCEGCVQCLEGCGECCINGCH